MRVKLSANINRVLSLVEIRRLPFNINMVDELNQLVQVPLNAQNKPFASLKVDSSWPNSKFHWRNCSRWNLLLSSMWMMRHYVG